MQASNHRCSRRFFTAPSSQSGQRSVDIENQAQHFPDLRKHHSAYVPSDRFDSFDRDRADVLALSHTIRLQAVVFIGSDLYLRAEAPNR